MAGTSTKNIARYLEMEALLNRFFGVLDFCQSQCISKANAERAPVTGCCRDKYYCKYDLEHPAYELLQKEREARYGPPGPYPAPGAQSPCEYHTPRGCRLLTHKSPICLGFFCREGIDYLRNQFSIFEYDYLGVYYALEWILTGELSGEAFEAFEASLTRMVQTVENAHRRGTCSSRG